MRSNQELIGILISWSGGPGIRTGDVDLLGGGIHMQDQRCRCRGDGEQGENQQDERVSGGRPPHDGEKHISTEATIPAQLSVICGDFSMPESGWQALQS